MEKAERKKAGRERLWAPIKSSHLSFPSQPDRNHRRRRRSRPALPRRDGEKRKNMKEDTQTRETERRERERIVSKSLFSPNSP